MVVDPRRVGVGVVIHRAARYRPVICKLDALGHGRLDFGTLTGIERDAGNVGTGGRGGSAGLRFSGHCGSDGRRGSIGRQCGRGAVGGGFLGQLRLDLAHLGKAKRTADTGGVDGVFGWQYDGYQQSAGDRG